MLIPIIPMAVDDGSPISGALSFDNITPQMSGVISSYTNTLKDAAERYGRRSPALIVDTAGMANGRSDTGFLKKVHSRKMSIWIMTPVVDVDDVFDAFYSGADVLVMPTHLVRSDGVLKEINRLSDRCIPAIFTKNGRTVNGRQISTDVTMLKQCGYSRVAIIETGKAEGPFWSDLSELDIGIIPFAGIGESPEHIQGLGFKEVFV